MAVGGGAEALGVGEVVGVAGGEVVVAGAVGAGAHVDVAVGGGVEHLVDGAGLGKTDDARGQPGVAVGVVRGVGLKHGSGHATGGEVAGGEFHGGIGLEFHPPVKAVEI